MSSPRFLAPSCAADLVAACGGYPAPTDHLANAYANIRAAQALGANNDPQASLHLKLAEEEQARAKELLPSAQTTLGNVAAALAKSAPETRFVVQGYTDSQGPEEYDSTLSQNRAETVRGFLISHGVASDRVTAEGFGPAIPVADNGTAEGRANNRRVEILVQSPPVPSETPALPTRTETTSTTTVR